MKYVLCAVALLATVAVTPAGEPGGGGKAAPLPGDALWDYGAWADDYLVIATAYDADKGEVTWTLKARKKVTARRYQARFTDPDLLELETKDIQLKPARKEYAKGEEVKAVMKMPPRETLQETNRVTIGGAP